MNRQTSATSRVRSIEGQVAGRRILLKLAVAATDPEAAVPAFPSRYELCTGVLDTGATVTGLSHKLVAKLGLAVRGRRRVLGVNGPAFHNYHVFRIGFDLADQTGTPSFPYFMEPTIEGIAWTDEASADVLIGMDVIELCDFTVWRTGKFRLDLP